MDFNEKSIEDLIWEAQKTKEGRKILRQNGLQIYGKMFRQLYLGEYGILDLLSLSCTGRVGVITLYELKKKTIDVAALMQAARYLTAIKTIENNIWHSLDHIDYRICLIGQDIQTNDDFVFLYNMMEDVKIYTYHIRIDGVRFEYQTHSWERVNAIHFDSLNLPPLTLSDLKEIVHG